MIKNKKRLFLIFGIILAFFLIALVFAFEGYLSNTIGHWTDKNEDIIGSRIIVLDVSQLEGISGPPINPELCSDKTGFCVNGVPISPTDNMFKTFVSGIQLPACPDSGQDTVYFEIYEKDSGIDAPGEDGQNDAIRVGTNKLNGKIRCSQNSITSTALALWAISIEDINKAGIEQDGIYEFYYKAITLENYEKIYDTLLKINITGLNTNLTTNLSTKWYDFNLNPIINSKQFDLVNLQNPTPSTDNSVYVEINGFPKQAQGRTFNIEIYEDDGGDGLDDSIRTGSKALSGTVDSEGKILTLWTLSEGDIVNAEQENYYEFYTKVVSGTQSATLKNYPVNITINGNVQEPNIMNAVGEWKDVTLSQVITAFSWQNSSANFVVPFSSNIDAPQGTQIIIEIYEKDAVGGDDSIRTVAKGNALTGSVTNLGQVYALWQITEEDLNNASEECTATSPCEFYFKLKYGAQEKSFENVVLEVAKTESTCININYCTDYLEEARCNQDDCNVANVTGTIFGIDCSLLGMNCGCVWNTGQGNCNFIFSNQNTTTGGEIYGSCQYLESGNDDCTDGILSFSWTGNWSWATGNSFLSQGECESSCGAGNCTEDGLVWHCDPSGAQTQCNSQSNSNSINCPAKVQLPGFNWINVVLIAIALVLIYFLIAWKRRNKKLRKKK